MTGVQVVALTAVMLLGVLVVLTYDPLRQALVTSVFGLTLAVLFVVLQAPDVALSELVVGTVAIPLVLLVTIAKTRHGDRSDE